MIGSGSQVIAVSEQEIVDVKALIGRDGIGCRPASATTVAGIRKLMAAGFIYREESIVAVLTGHILKDPDSVSYYHRGTLSLGLDATDRKAESRPMLSELANRARSQHGSISAKRAKASAPP